MPKLEPINNEESNNSNSLQSNLKKPYHQVIDSFIFIIKGFY